MRGEFVRLVTGVGCVSAVALGLIGCGSAGKKSVGKGGAAEAEKVDVVFSIVQASNALNARPALSFDLALPTTSEFKILVSGCSSAFVPPPIISTNVLPKSSVAMYKYDTDCKASLENFKWAGYAATFTKVGGGALESGAAIFSDGAGNEMNVTVFQQLDSPLTASSKAIFVVQEIKSGIDHAPPSANYSQANELYVEGVEAPYFDISSVHLTAVASGSGLPSFTMAFECKNTTVGTPRQSCPSALLNNQDMVGMKMKMVFDSYSGVITYSQAQTIMATGAVSIGLPAISDSIGTKGGFQLLGVQPDVGPLATKKNFLVIIEYNDTVRSAKSYRYFNMDVGDPQ